MHSVCYKPDFDCLEELFLSFPLPPNTGRLRHGSRPLGLSDSIDSCKYRDGTRLSTIAIMIVNLHTIKYRVLVACALRKHVCKHVHD